MAWSCKRPGFIIMKMVFKRYLFSNGLIVVLGLLIRVPGISVKTSEYTLFGVVV